MSSDSPDPLKESSPLPKATMPVELAPIPAQPSVPDSFAPKPVPPVEVLVEPDDPENPANIVPAEVKPRGFGAWVKSLNVFEKFCCGMIALGIIVFAAVVFVPALFSFPKEPEFAKASDFPIKGDWVEVSAAETFWREPVLEGPDADTARSGTALLPVLDLKLKGTGKIRVLFRDAVGGVVGDSLTHALAGDQDFSAVCTMGLKQMSDFTAYQSGEAGSWSVELHEGSSDASAAGDYSLLFQMNISPTRK